jgi:flagellar biosynthesis anti-sigma factor FlgM
MKIDGNRLGPDTVTTGRVDAAQADRQGRVGKSGAGQGDQVRVSSDAQLATAAAAAAAGSPDIRHDKVASAKKALEAGSIGADTVRLADKMIDSLLGR